MRFWKYVCMNERRLSGHVSTVVLLTCIWTRGLFCCINSWRSSPSFASTCSALSLKNGADYRLHKFTILTQYCKTCHRIHVTSTFNRFQAGFLLNKPLLNPNRSTGIVIRLRRDSRRVGVPSQYGEEIILCCKVSRPTLDPTQLSTQWASDLKRRRREAGHTPPRTTKLKHLRSCTSSPQFCVAQFSHNYAQGKLHSHLQKMKDRSHAMMT